MRKHYSDRVWYRIASYVLITACIQIVSGLILYGTMYSRGPMSLLFLLVMTNIAYPWLMQHAIAVQFWPYAIVIGASFMFLVILSIGEIMHLRKKG